MSFSFFFFFFVWTKTQQKCLFEKKKHRGPYASFLMVFLLVQAVLAFPWQRQRRLSSYKGYKLWQAAGWVILLQFVHLEQFNFTCSLVRFIAVHLPFCAVNNPLFCMNFCVCLCACVGVCENSQHLLFAKLIIWVAVQ